MLIFISAFAYHKEKFFVVEGVGTNSFFKRELMKKKTAFY